MAKKFVGLAGIPKVKALNRIADALWAIAAALEKRPIPIDLWPDYPTRSGALDVVLKTAAKE